MLKASELTYQYSNSALLSFPSFELNRGKHLCISGPSGSGKSTLLSLLTGLAQPRSGSIQYDDLKFETLSQAQKDAYRGQYIGLVFQENYLINSVSLFENLTYACHFGKINFDSAYAQRLLSMLNLPGKEKKKPNELSLGERQRAAIARALIKKPSYFFADEPTSSLDDENCKSVLEILLNSAQEIDSSLVVITHDHRVKSAFKNHLEL